MVTISKQLLFLILLCSIFNGCEEEACLQCNTYNFFDFNGDLDSNTGDFNVCEFDAMWDLIDWKNLQCPGGTLYFFDLHNYTIGHRVIDNDDIDDDGIVNENDNDIDNDGIVNLLDETPFGNENNEIWELLICK